VTRHLRLQLEAVNPLAALVILGAVLLAALGKMPAESALLLAAGVAVPGHSTPPTD
jgi:hypothetical protein